MTGSAEEPGKFMSAEVKIYYGAADTVECLATARLDDLIGACLPVQVNSLVLPEWDS